ncbi:MAG: TylF/MycF/NovP-related O-methyltransferase [Parvularculaceae bacterium]
MINWLKKRYFTYQSRNMMNVWPVKRFLPTTDLDLSAEEQAEIKNAIHGWRQLVPWYLRRFRPAPDDGEFYCFGVAHGSTVDGLVTALRDRKMPVPHIHLFDSFQGLPQEDPNVAVPLVWKAGAYAAPRSKLEARIDSLQLPKGNYTIHEGWFSETLKPALVASGEFKPAAYVDIDADLYNSTAEILDFMFSQKLIGPGTLIGYDDWGDTDLWTAGESRAHKEIVAKYGAQCAQLFSWGQAPLIKKLFLVVSIGTGRA